MISLNAEPERFVVWTPDLTELNGQCIVTQRVVEEQADRIERICEYPGRTVTSIPIALLSSFRLLLWTLAHRNIAVYVVCSRSTLGFLRDVLPLSAALFGRRVIAHVHGSDFPKLLGRPFIGPWARWLYAHVEVIVPSEHLLQPLTHYSFRKLIVCENFASFAHPGGAQTPQRSEGAFTILWNSNVMSSKGIGDLVEGIRELRSEGHEVRLIMLGKVIGDNEKSLAEMKCEYEKFAREDWVDARGSVPLDEVSRLVEDSDLVALPSTYSSECQPLAIIMAMVAAKRVLVSDTPAMQATIGDYPATITQRNPAAIAQAIRPLLDDKQSVTLTAGAENARSRFGTAAFDKRMESVFGG